MINLNKSMSVAISLSNKFPLHGLNHTNQILFLAPVCNLKHSMADAEEDFSKLPLEARLTHKVPLPHNTNFIKLLLL